MLGLEHNIAPGKGRGKMQKGRDKMRRICPAIGFWCKGLSEFSMPLLGFGLKHGGGGDRLAFPPQQGLGTTSDSGSLWGVPEWRALSPGGPLW